MYLEIGASLIGVVENDVDQRQLGNHSDEFTIFVYHRRTADVMLREKLNRFLDRRLGPDGNDIWVHDLTNRNHNTHLSGYEGRSQSEFSPAFETVWIQSPTTSHFQT